MKNLDIKSFLLGILLSALIFVILWFNLNTGIGRYQISGAGAGDYSGMIYLITDTKTGETKEVMSRKGNQFGIPFKEMENRPAIKWAIKTDVFDYLEQHPEWLKRWTEL